MEFTQTDELGLKRTYYVITELEDDDEKYILYSDLLKDNNQEFRLLVGKIINGKVIREEKETETKVKEYFKAIEKDYINYMKEMI